MYNGVIRSIAKKWESWNSKKKEITIGTVTEAKRDKYEEFTNVSQYNTIIF